MILVIPVQNSVVRVGDGSKLDPKQTWVLLFPVDSLLQGSNNEVLSTTSVLHASEK